jgi:hypothetical protein
MVRDHHPTVKEIVREFYANLHQRHSDSFRVWIRGKGIEVTPTLISNIIGAPSVRDLVYPWPVDHLPICAKMVK